MRDRTTKREPPEPCPVETVLTLMQPKWTARILYLLYQDPKHFSTLKRSLPGISSEVLTVRLRSLSTAELVESRRDNDSRRVIYSVTDRGRTLEPILWCMAGWGLQELERRGLAWNI